MLRWIRDLLTPPTTSVDGVGTLRFYQGVWEGAIRSGSDALEVLLTASREGPSALQREALTRFVAKLETTCLSCSDAIKSEFGVSAVPTSISVLPEGSVELGFTCDDEFYTAYFLDDVLVEIAYEAQRRPAGAIESTSRDGFSMKVLSCGPCPVCFESGALIALRSKTDGSVVYWCPMCETAWPSHPRGRVDSITALITLAPDGVEVISSEDVSKLAADFGFTCAEPELDWTKEIAALLR